MAHESGAPGPRTKGREALCRWAFRISAPAVALKLTLRLRSGSSLTQVKQRAIEFRYGLLTSRVSGGGLYTLYRAEPGLRIPIAVLGVKFAKRSRLISDAISD